MSTGNRSTAVGAQRARAGMKATLNLFPTPPFATRALMEDVLLRPAQSIELGMNCWDPCCGRGHMTIPLREYFDTVFASDIHDWAMATSAT